MSIRCPRKLAALILALSMLPLPALAETPAVTTGAGYKKMVEQVGALYREKSGKPLTEMYGGAIGPILEQIKAGSGASVVVSDKATLEASDVPFASFQPLGEAVLVLAWKKGIDIKSVDDLRTPYKAAAIRINSPPSTARRPFLCSTKAACTRNWSPSCPCCPPCPRSFPIC